MFFRLAVADGRITAMKLDISLEEILVIGAVLCALIVAIGMISGNVPVAEGGAIIVSLCGGTVIVKALRALTQNSSA